MESHRDNSSAMGKKNREVACITVYKGENENLRTIKFRKDKNHDRCGFRELTLQNGSIYVMEGDSNEHCYHKVMAGEADRIAITARRCELDMLKPIKQDPVIFFDVEEGRPNGFTYMDGFKECWKLNFDKKDVNGQPKQC